MWSSLEVRKEKKKCGPAVHVVCILLCSYYVAIISHWLEFLQAPLVHFRRTICPPTNQHIHFPFYSKRRSVIGSVLNAADRQTVLRAIIYLKDFPLPPHYNVDLQMRLLADLENVPLANREMSGCSSLIKPIQQPKSSTHLYIFSLSTHWFGSQAVPKLSCCFSSVDSRLQSAFLSQKFCFVFSWGRSASTMIWITGLWLNAAR